MQRKAKKIDAPDFLLLMCIESQKGSPSYNHLASRMDAVCNISASKQAFCKRVNEPCVAFFKAALAKVMQSKFSDHEIALTNACNKYRRVLVQDSTIIRLPLRLFSTFSGVSNAYDAVCNARIQGVYDLLSGCFISFSIDPYSKNDLTAAPELDILQGDLVLRDRGYLRNDEIKRHLDIGADCIYRHRTKTNYLDPSSGNAIDLVALLKKHGTIDRVVSLNNPERTLVRLVAAPVSSKVANERRRKAKNKKKYNPSKKVLELMSWTIFITTIPTSQASFKQILAIYGLRWKIEIIFKIWKSHMQFGNIHNVSENQLYVLLFTRFILIVMYTHKLYHPCLISIRKQAKKELSMIKFFKYVIANPEKIAIILKALYQSAENQKKALNTIARYCTYDSRKRLNMNELLTKTLLS